MERAQIAKLSPKEQRQFKAWCNNYLAKKLEKDNVTKRRNTNPGHAI